MAQLRTVKGPDACWVSGPFCFCRWLCTPLACDGRRSGHPRYAGRVLKQHINPGSSPLRGASGGGAVCCCLL